MTMTKYVGPNWDNSSEYGSIGDQKLIADLQRGEDLIAQIQEYNPRLREYVNRASQLALSEIDEIVPCLLTVSELYEQAAILLGNVGTYISCAQSVDGSNSEAKTMMGRVRKEMATLFAAQKPMELLLTLGSSELIQKYLQGDRTQYERFNVESLRKTQDQRLSLAEEDLIIGLSVDGFTAWSTLYDNLSGAIRCRMKLGGDKEETIGLTQAISYLDDANPELRREAYQAVNNGWSAHQESCAAILNSLAGTRLELARRRSHTKLRHFLDESLHQNRMELSTLNTIMAAVADARELGRRALRAQAKALGAAKLSPWDRFAPPPKQLGQDEQRMSFVDACALISDAFSQVSPEMGDFVRMMVKNNWIDGGEGQNRRPGAYCTKFIKSRTPRVFLTYSGGMKDVMTLAHELGHAFHNWQMRELPWAQIGYPMTLAETASIFAETVVSDSLVKNAKNPGETLAVQWDSARDAEAFLLNISARFTFESEFYERRKAGIVAAQDISEIMERHWRDWYGDSLVEMDSLFWCTKLHFHLSGISFYNYPYIFGYLFSLGVYAQRPRLGADFFPAYQRLLRDTGRMTVEDVAKVHLGVDLGQPDFWLNSLAMVEKKVAAFESSVRELGL